ncbi:hypothetical protein V5O48_005338 [Marasmius crinis-equi]|uniref:Hydrophobin n=1 Tax=Marasmius crinis-equi TaxID=585013 RepID=A0ABR3FMM1_9AGAR
MFARVAAVSLVAAAFVAAAPAGSSTCSSGPVQCCNSVQDASNPTVQGLLGLLGVAVSSVTAQVGVTCSPISVLGAGGNSCASQTVCCENNSFNGIVALGCNNISL